MLSWGFGMREKAITLCSELGSFWFVCVLSSRRSALKCNPCAYTLSTLMAHPYRETSSFRSNSRSLALIRGFIFCFPYGLPSEAATRTLLVSYGNTRKCSHWRNIQPADALKNAWRNFNQPLVR